MKRIRCKDGGTITFPTDEDRHDQRYAPINKHHLAVASALDSYAYLVLECTRDEVWQRIKDIRAALSPQRTSTGEDHERD